MSVVRALDDPDDAVLSNHRNHGHFLTYSGEFDGLVARSWAERAACAAASAEASISHSATSTATAFKLA